MKLLATMVTVLSLFGSGAAFGQAAAGQLLMLHRLRYRKDVRQSK
jgi:hypothetical protein